MLRCLTFFTEVLVCQLAKINSREAKYRDKKNRRGCLLLVLTDAKD